MLKIKTLLFVILVGFCLPANAGLDADATPLSVLRAALSGQVIDLEHYFKTVVKNDSHDRSDYDAYLAFEIFNNPNPALQSPLDKWVQTHPESPYGLTARGLHRLAVALQLRGSDATSDTPREKLAAMEVHINQAHQDLQSAMRLTPSLSVTSATMVRVLTVTGDRARLDAIARDALRANPLSFAVRLAHLNAQVPRWGGTFEQLVAAQDEAGKGAKQNPDLQRLHGFSHATLADGYFRNDDSEKALQFANEAVSLGLSDVELVNVARIFVAAEDYDRADELLDQALALYPARLMTLFWKGKVADLRGDTTTAEGWYIKALQINPVNSETLSAQARLLSGIGEIARAESSYREALTQLGAEDPDLVNDYIYLLVSKSKDFDRARVIAEQSHHLLDDSRGLYWYSYGVALAGLKDCKTVSAMKRYQQNCAGTERLCNAAALKGAEQQIRAVVDPGRCADAPAFGTS